VRLGPSVGEDACAIDVAGGVLVVATDPITLTGRDLGRLVVTVNANDVAVTGARPRWFLATVLLPAGTTEPQVAELFAAMRSALDAVGAVLVGGHTEVTSVVREPVVVGQMLGLAQDHRIVTTGGVQPGDVIVQVGRVPVEGAAVLAAEAGNRLAGVDPAVRAEAACALDDPGISVVEAALAATTLGATSLHDPTEGGLASGLHEVAAAGGVALRIDVDAVLWFEPGVRVCRALGLDPWATIASGALLAAFAPRDADWAALELTARGFEVATIGAAEAGEGVHTLDGTAIPWPSRDEVARALE
jgi:hydrogenase maturation factor